jgi:hypothetical protein
MIVLIQLQSPISLSYLNQIRKELLCYSFTLDNKSYLELIRFNIFHETTSIQQGNSFLTILHYQFHLIHYRFIRHDQCVPWQLTSTK